MFFAGPDDDRAFREYGDSIGLSLIPPRIDRIGCVPVEGPGSASFWYFSNIRPQELHPYGDPKVKISDALDPLVQYSRSFYDPPNLIAGRIYWSNDVPELASRSKPIYSKLAAWIKKSWERRRQDGYYVGPQAKRLADEEGIEFFYLPPGLQVTVQKTK